MPPSSSSPPPITKAFVLGAGLGTRLRRLTESRPKPLVLLCGRPLITHTFDHLLGVGIEEIIVNTHHRAEVYSRIFPDDRYLQASLQFRHEPLLLETGGGIKNIEDLVGKAPFVVYNGDLLSTLPLAPAIAHHTESGNEVTLILRSCGGPLHISLEQTGGTTTPIGRITDIRQTFSTAPATHLLTGIYLISPAFFRRLTVGKSSVIPFFLEMIKEGKPPGAIVIDEGEWWDLGTREQIIAAHQHRQSDSPAAPWVHPTAQIAPDAVITGATAIGAHSIVGAGVHLHDSILWDEVNVAPHSSLTRCIITDHQSVDGIHVDRDF